ncbi:MAG: C1 family peptidase [Candidatus Woesearchaeota archaeon]
MRSINKAKYFFSLVLFLAMFLTMTSLIAINNVNKNFYEGKIASIPNEFVLLKEKTIEFSDGVCDPATHNIVDNFCDVDCLPANGVCDPDCKSYDPDCPSKNNYICEPERGENCENTKDCSCKDEEACRVDCEIQGIRESGCINKTLLYNNGAKCNYSCQCLSNNCIFGYCCEKGEYFNQEKGKCISFLGDDICNSTSPFFENCTFSSKDCNCNNLELGECCVNCTGNLENGCCPKNQINCSGNCKEIKTKSKQGENCECDAECEQDLKCSKDSNNPSEMACCPQDMEWDSKTKTCIQKVCSYPCTPNCILPKKWDWRNVNGVNYLTPVKNQAHCGSCWAFSTAGAIEGTHNVYNNCPGCNVDLSEQQLVSCSPEGDCQGSWPNLAFDYLKGFGGIVEESCMNYQSSNCGTNPCSASCSCNQRCSKPCTCDLCSNYKDKMYSFESYEMVSNEFVRIYPIINYSYIKADVEKIKRAVVCNGPLSVASLNWLHAIVLVGYDDERKLWIIKNSWGPNWGSNGYAGIPYTGHPYSDIIGYTIAVKNVKKVS